MIIKHVNKYGDNILLVLPICVSGVEVGDVVGDVDVAAKIRAMLA